MMGKVKGIARNETKKPAKNFISRFYKFVHADDISAQVRGFLPRKLLSYNIQRATFFEPLDLLRIVSVIRENSRF